MSGNYKLAIEQIIAETERHFPKKAESTVFELASAGIILRGNPPSSEILLAGNTGNSGDGGIDAIYLSLNRQYITKIEDLPSKLSSPNVRIVILQAKTKNSFEESPLTTIQHHVGKLLNVENDSDSASYDYNSQVTASFKAVRKVLRETLTSQSAIDIDIFYCTKSSNPPSKGVRSIASGIEVDLQRDQPRAKVNVHLWGARELVDYHNSFLIGKRKISFTDYCSIANGWLGLVSLKDYYDFISTENSILDRLFESNVRDYIPNAEVNKAIKLTLEGDYKTDFWWLNNGITIVTKDATADPDKVLNMEEPQIVNGLQTSYNVFNFGLGSEGIFKSQRHVAVKVLKAPDAITQAKIISGSNLQSPVKAWQLYSQKKYQVELQKAFEEHKWFYDRRENYYKNRNKPHKRIFSIPFLVRAVIAILFLNPLKAAESPRTSVREEDYGTVFETENLTFDDYLIVVRIAKQCEQYVDGYRFSPSVTTQQKEVVLEFKYHLMLMAAVWLTGSEVYSNVSLRTADERRINKATFAKLVKALNHCIKTHAPDGISYLKGSPEFQLSLVKEVLHGMSVVTEPKE